MKILNPGYVSPETPEQSEMVLKEADLRAWFHDNPGQKSVSFDDIRGVAGKTAKQWPDGLIHQKLIDLGFEVVPV